MPLKPIKIKPRLEEKKKDAHKAYDWAVYKLKRRWPEAEPEIMKNPYVAYLYASDVIGDAWPEAEPNIMKDGYSAYLYAVNVLNKRWPEAEPAIKKLKLYWEYYTSHFKIK